MQGLGLHAQDVEVLLLPGLGLRVSQFGLKRPKPETLGPIFPTRSSLRYILKLQSCWS